MEGKRSNHNVVYSCRYHIIFCPKYRRKVLIPPIDERLKTIVVEQIERWGQALWTNSYFCSTVGGVTRETLKRYVESQKGQ